MFSCNTGTTQKIETVYVCLFDKTVIYKVENTVYSHFGQEWDMLERTGAEEVDNGKTGLLLFFLSFDLVRWFF